MKATGIVRRIDDLGRVVIPKEIRRTLRIREGDPLEIFTDREGEIILKKYSPIGELSAFSVEYAESMAQTTGYVVCITDTDQIVAAAGSGKKELQNQAISKALADVIEAREQVLAGNGEKKYQKITAEQQSEYAFQSISPIICQGDAIGAVVLLGRDADKKFGETEKMLTQTAAGFLGRQMEQ